MYQSLLLSTGGGIISNVQKSLQDDAPVLIIGVGGTGAKALDTLKKKVHKQLLEDNPGSTVPEYNHIRFLEIDSDAEWVANTNLDNSQEFANLQDPGIRAKFTNEVTRNDMLKKPQFQWLEAEDIRIPESLHGAGGVRQLGRYMIVNSAQSVYTKIKTNIANAIAGRKASDLVIHIMAGISGGMGSGCFIDVCYIVRKVLQDLAADAAVVFGYFFLPDVITTIPTIAASPNKITANYRNGYAALTELDYLMNLKENYGRFTQNYGSFSIDTDMPPVDMCHLVSALDAGGNSKTDGYKYCMNVVADYVMSYLSEPDGGAITPKGSLANINMGVDLLPIVKGAYNRYHVMGASNAELPMTQVATYLATQLYEKMSGYLRRGPVDQDVVDFAEKNMGLKIPELKRLMSKDVKLSREVPSPEMFTVKNITASYVHAESILKPMNDWLAQQEGTVERNYRGLDADVKKYERDENATSMIGILYNKLADLALNASYGPYYAIGMLSRTGKDINAILQGLHLEADKLVKDAEHQANFQSEQVERAKQAFTSSKNTLFNKNIESSAYDEYRGAMGIWYRRQLDVVIYRYVDKLILGLQKKADDMYKHYFSKLKTLLDELDVTFQTNKSYFEGGHGDDLSDDGFTIRIMKFSDIKPHLDAVMMDERPEDAAVGMVKTFLDEADEWLSGEEYRISRMVNKFISARYKNEMNKSMQQYLEEKYPGKNPAERVQALQKDLLQPLMDASEPLFWCSSTVSTDDTFSSINLSYPKDAPDIVAATTNFKAVHPETELRACNIGDRTFMLRLYSGMPLFGYHGLTLMKEHYDKCDKEGVHLFGKGETNWKTLPTPIPYSLNPAAVRGGNDVEAAFNKAKSPELGLLVVDPKKVGPAVLKKPLVEDQNAVEFLKELCCIGAQKEEDYNKISAQVIAELKDKYFKQDGEVELGKINDWSNRLEKLKTDIKQGKYESYSIPHHGSESVVLDNIVHSPVMTKVLLDAVELYDAVEMGLERLDIIYDEESNVRTDINDFANALFTGVLKQGIGKISFNYVERHVEKEAILASKAMPFASFLYYQAYVSFKSLDERIKEDIIAQANANINDLQEGDDAIADKISAKLTPRDMADLERQYNKLAERDDIANFYNKFMDLLYEYLEQFR